MIEILVDKSSFKNELKIKIFATRGFNVSDINLHFK